jgi:carbon storage regulator CsrA
MLVLTRRSDERIHIGEDVTITIVRVKGNAVRIGIEAPRSIPVLRGELAASAHHALEPFSDEFYASLATC